MVASHVKERAGKTKFAVPIAFLFESHLTTQGEAYGFSDVRLESL